jgi:hypothetical protein
VHLLPQNYLRCFVLSEARGASLPAPFLAQPAHPTVLLQLQNVPMSSPTRIARRASRVARRGEPMNLFHRNGDGTGEAAHPPRGGPSRLHELGQRHHRTAVFCTRGRARGRVRPPEEMPGLDRNRSDEGSGRILAGSRRRRRGQVRWVPHGWICRQSVACRE